jgi:hypothetical protein
MVEITLPILLQIVQTLGILVGIVYYITIMRNTQKTRELTLQSQEQALEAQKQALETRQAQLFMNLYQRSSNPSFDDAQHRIIDLKWKDWDEYQALFDYTNPETRDNHLAMSSIMNFYEGVGVLVLENLVDIRLIYLLMGSSIKGFWEKVEPIVEEARESWYYPKFVINIEYLYNELMKYIEEHPEFETPRGDRRNRDARRAHW